MRLKSFILSLFTVLLVFSSSITTAQVTAGRYIVGLSGSASISSADLVGSTWGVSLQPSALYLLTDQLALGGVVGVSMFGGAGRVTRNVRNTFVSSAIIPTARYYLSRKGKGGLFLSAGAGLGINSDFFNRTTFNYNGGIGFTVFLSDGLAFEPRLRVRGEVGELISANYGLTIGLQGFVDRIFPAKTGGE